MVEEAVILLVDDNSVNRAVLFDYLDGRNYRVLIAETGEAAVEIAALTRPSVILMDIMLPGIDGYEACRRIKSSSAGKDIPIIFMSALDDNQSRAEGLKAGGSAHITKPVLYDEVASLVETYLKLRKYEAASKVHEGTQSDPPSEFDAIVDIIVHDIKSPLVCILGFADELTYEFAEKEVPQEWVEYTSIIKKSSSDIDINLDALVMLKNLRLHKSESREMISLEEMIERVATRYDSFQNHLPLELVQKLSATKVISEATLLEELTLILWRNFSNLNSETGTKLSLQIESNINGSGMVVLSMAAITRQISEQELPHILKPMTGGKRRKVKNTNTLTICAQKLIEHLAINAWARITDEGLSISLAFPAAVSKSEHVE